MAGLHQTDSVKESHAGTAKKDFGSRLLVVYCPQV